MLDSIKLVVFDLDGTLANLPVDWEGLRAELRRHFQSRYGFDSNFRPFDSEIEEVGQKLGDSALREAYQIVERHELENIEEVSPVNGALELVQELKDRGKSLAILSSNTHRAIERALEHLGIREHFDIIVGKEDVVKHKPDPEGLILIKDRAGVSGDETCYIGDRSTDMECAARAGACGLSIERALELGKEVSP